MGCNWVPQDWQTSDGWHLQHNIEGVFVNIAGFGRSDTFTSSLTTAEV